MKDYYTVTKNWIAGEYMYQVGRTIDPGQPLHSGNIEMAACCDTKEEAERVARYLNGKEENQA